MFKAMMFFAVFVSTTAFASGVQKDCELYRSSKRMPMNVACAACGMPAMNGEAKPVPVSLRWLQLLGATARVYPKYEISEKKSKDAASANDRQRIYSKNMIYNMFQYGICEPTIQTNSGVTTNLLSIKDSDGLKTGIAAFDSVMLTGEYAKRYDASDERKEYANVFGFNEYSGLRKFSQSFHDKKNRPPKESQNSVRAFYKDALSSNTAQPALLNCISQASQSTAAPGSPFNLNDESSFEEAKRFCLSMAKSCDIQAAEGFCSEVIGYAIGSGNPAAGGVKPSGSKMFGGGGATQ